MPSASVGRPEQINNFGVDGRTWIPQSLGTDLVVFPIAAGLRAVVTKNRGDVVELHGLRQVVEAILYVRTDDGSRALGPQASASRRHGPRSCTSPSALGPLHRLSCA